MSGGQKISTLAFLVWEFFDLGSIMTVWGTTGNSQLSMLVRGHSNHEVLGAREIVVVTMDS